MLSTTVFAEDKKPLKEKVAKEWKRHGTGLKTTTTINKIHEVEEIENNSGGVATELSVTYSDDGRKDVHWNEGAKVTTFTNGQKDKTIDANYDKDGNRDFISTKVTNLNIDPKKKVKIQFEATLNKNNFVKKTWKWTKKPGPNPNPNPGPDPEAVDHGGSMQEIAGETNFRQNGDKQARLLFIDNPTGEKITLKNLKWKSSDNNPAPEELMDPAFWANTQSSPNVEIQRNNYSAPVPIYNLAPTTAETIVISWDRYDENDVYLDTVYSSMEPNGTGWNFTAGMDLTNNASNSQTGVNYNIQAADNQISSPSAGASTGVSSPTLSNPEEIKIEHSSGSIANGNIISTWASGIMANSGDIAMSSINWGDDSAAAKDWAIYFTEPLPDILFDAEYSFTNYYDTSVRLTDLNLAVTNTFLNAADIFDWNADWDSLGLASYSLLAPGQTITYTVPGVRPWQNISAKGSILSASGKTKYEDFGFSHKDYHPVTEPTTFILLGSGLMGMVIGWRKKTAQSNKLEKSLH